MVKVIGIRFRNAGKIYYFDPEDIKLTDGDKVIVETVRGLKFGEVVGAVEMVTEDKITPPLKKVVRKATLDDEDRVEINKEKQERAFEIALDRIEAHKLPMKLVDVEYAFDNTKIIFFFTSDGRVDFRELVRDLAGIFKTRIELRQIGVRDEAKMVGGLGTCGRPLCCVTFLEDFEPVSIRIAKDQNLSLNPSKISGMCGRLMCCLRYEHEAYQSLRKGLPSVGSKYQTSKGTGKIVDLNILSGVAMVQLDDGTIVSVNVRKKNGDVKLDHNGSTAVSGEGEVPCRDVPGTTRREPVKDKEKKAGSPTKVVSPKRRSKKTKRRRQSPVGKRQKKSEPTEKKQGVPTKSMKRQTGRTKTDKSKSVANDKPDRGAGPRQRRRRKPRTFSGKPRESGGR
ncbi:MAG: stage 0 sporulation family protein [Firmicutes bacterium]|jgi:cell fate regulator YaaT (PSP1 superfamily)|nr:stage 0 sporulation family protein [Bacillota bacterium]